MLKGSCEEAGNRERRVVDGLSEINCGLRPTAAASMRSCEEAGNREPSMVYGAEHREAFLTRSIRRTPISDVDPCDGPSVSPTRR